MEAKKEMADRAQSDDHLQEKKDDPASDRESSVESFHTNKSEFSTTAESELIDVDDIELSDEESWLYKSPKKLPSSDKTFSTSKWLRTEKDNFELQDNKDALIRKLNQLQTRSAVLEKHLAKENDDSVKESHDARNVTVPYTNTEGESNVAFLSSKVSNGSAPELPKNIQESISVKGKENDVLDVQKIAQLQEESLRLNTQRFLGLVEKKGISDKKCFRMPNTKLSKPASVEALNVCNGKLAEEVAYPNLIPMQTLKKQNHFGSSTFLHNQDAHRGSLPNINPGYFSLRSKKSKKSPDQKLPCPLPLHPSHLRLPQNGAGSHASSPNGSQCKLTSPRAEYYESQTLPSSYRINSRSNSSSRKDLNSPRRESSPFVPGPRSGSGARRESAPCNGPRYLSPLSSPTLYPRSNVSSPFLTSPGQPRRNSSKDLKTPPGGEYHRPASHSPSRRQPLSTMHNRSPKHGNGPASPRSEDRRGFKLTSKIPSPGPATRSGIPVPSSYSSRMSSDDESWSHDCF